MSTTLVRYATGTAEPWGRICARLERGVFAHCENKFAFRICVWASHGTIRRTRFFVILFVVRVNGECLCEVMWIMSGWFFDVGLLHVCLWVCICVLCALNAHIMTMSDIEKCSYTRVFIVTLIWFIKNGFVSFVVLILLQEVLEARILELEEALQRLQKRVNEVCKMNSISTIVHVVGFYGGRASKL